MAAEEEKEKGEGKEGMKNCSDIIPRPSLLKLEVGNDLEARLLQDKGQTLTTYLL